MLDRWSRLRTVTTGSRRVVTVLAVATQDMPIVGSRLRSSVWLLQRRAGRFTTEEWRRQATPGLAGARHTAALHHDNLQPCGHRLSGDLTGLGALASIRDDENGSPPSLGRCVTGINRADSASGIRAPRAQVDHTTFMSIIHRSCRTAGAETKRPSSKFLPTCIENSIGCLRTTGGLPTAAIGRS